tara:strand:+ start:623 stop:1633 length:1011 start_codon:yes stop_codon:yes gene_type:complete
MICTASRSPQGKDLPSDNSKSTTFGAKINTIIFSADGLIGISHLGVILHLYSKLSNIFFQNIKTFIGASIGSIWATLLSLQLQPKVIIDVFFNFLYKDLIQTQCDVSIKKFKEKWGVSEIKFDNFKYFLQKYVNEQITVKQNILGCKSNQSNTYGSLTFLQHKQIFNTHLIISTFNLQLGALQQLDYINTPNLDIITALKMSTAIPGLLKPVTLAHDSYTYIDPIIVEKIPKVPVDLYYHNARTPKNVLIISVNIEFNFIKSTRTRNTIFNYFTNILFETINASNNLRKLTEEQEGIHIKVDIKNHKKYFLKFEKEDLYELIILGYFSSKKQNLPN